MKKCTVLVIAVLSAIYLPAQNIGIGTTSPNASAVLDVSSTTKGMLIPRMTTAQRIAIQSPPVGLMVFDTDFKDFFYANGSWMRVLNNTYWSKSTTRNYLYNSIDSVGIGTSTPDEKLHIVNGKIYMQDNRTGQNPHVIFDVPATNLKEAGLQFKRSGDTLASINYRENTSVPNYIKLAVSSAGTGADLVINSNGNTGLGVIEPLVKLHVYDRLGSEVVRLEAETPTIQLRRRTSPANGFPVTFTDVGFVQTSGDNLRIGTNSDNDFGKFVVRTNGADRLFVDASGNVSIGTTATAAGYMLNVGGKAICEELKVQLEGAWPDYVFDEKYKLTPLNELQKFVDTHNHLPNIPSAKDVKANGIEVGDMQRRMMEKIEELTLYILEMKKEMDVLKQTKQ